MCVEWGCVGRDLQSARLATAEVASAGLVSHASMATGDLCISLQTWSSTPAACSPISPGSTAALPHPWRRAHGLLRHGGGLGGGAAGGGAAPPGPALPRRQGPPGQVHARVPGGEMRRRRGWGVGGWCREWACRRKPEHLCQARDTQAATALASTPAPLLNHSLSTPRPLAPPRCSSTPPPRTWWPPPPPRRWPWASGSSAPTTPPTASSRSSKTASSSSEPGVRWRREGWPGLASSISCLHTAVLLPARQVPPFQGTLLHQPSLCLHSVPPTLLAGARTSSLGTLSTRWHTSRTP